MAAARELIAQAHLLVEDFPPGTLEGWELGIEDLQQLNPKLVLLRISAFGRSGPLRDRQATPLTMQAASGWISARDPQRPPVQVGARISEYVAGAYGALGALTALRSPKPLWHNHARRPAGERGAPRGTPVAIRFRLRQRRCRLPDCGCST